MNLENVIEDIKIIYEIVARNITNKTKKHNLIQDQVCKLAEQYGYVGEKEYIMENVFKLPDGEERNGRVDVVWKDGISVVLAFEVDSSYRPKSEEKLIKIKAKYKVWLCYTKIFKRPAAQSKDIHYILPFYKVDDKI